MDRIPLLSVIMPVYNAEEYLKTALNNLLEQTFTDLEIICVNDRSKDKSIHVLRDFAAVDPRVVILDCPKNIGAGAARNLGLREARGRYITFMDADDSIEPDLYEQAIALAERCHADEVVWGLTEEHYDRQTRHIRSFPIAPPDRICRTEASCMSLFLELEQTTLFGYQWNSLYRAELIRAHNIRFEKTLFYEDFFFNLAVARQVKTLATLSHTGYHYFKRVNQSITNQFSSDYYDLSYRRVAEFFTFLQAHNALTDFAYHVLGNRLLRYTLSALCQNVDAKSEMEFRERRKWFLTSCARPLYDQLLPHSKPSHPAYVVLKYAILKKSAPLALTLGRIVSMLR